MLSIDSEEFQKFVEGLMVNFHTNILEDIRNIKITDLISKKDPYFYITKGFNSVELLINFLLSTYLHESEESKFGTVLEEIIRYIAERNLGGFKSSADGIDLEFVKDNDAYLVAVKSGPNWGNADQINSMKRNFAAGKKRRKSNNTSSQNIISLNGCCYGRTGISPNKGEYIKLCGQDFWSLISGDDDFYSSPLLLDVLKNSSANHSSEFKNSHDTLVSNLSKSFAIDFCKNDGLIDYVAILEFNSGSKILQSKHLHSKFENAIIAIFTKHSNSSYLPRELITNEVLISLNVKPKDYPSTAKAIKDFLLESSLFEDKRGKIFMKKANKNAQ